jgi:two-component system sensor histidine kinase/response regulator
MSPPPQPCTLIVVDDSAVNRVAMSALLEPLVQRVVMAGVASDLPALIAAHQPALAIVDLHLPAEHGLAKVAELSAAEIPAFVLGPYRYDSVPAQRAFALGAIDYLQRPFDGDTLRVKLGTLLKLVLRARAREQEAEEALKTIATAISQRAAAQRAIRERDRYIGVLGHDLRNPLAAIRMGLQLLLQSQTLTGRDRGRVVRMVGTADRMHDMIRDLLDFTRTSVGGFPHRPVATDLRRLCEASVDELRAVHPERTITIDVSGDLTGVWDPDRLKQALLNLLGNAIDHGGDGPVGIRIEGAGQDVVLSVHNDGEPIPASVLPVLFEPFRRGDGSPHGLGLGLYIVREIVRSHGGAIEVHSTAAEGTTFVSRWPRTPRSPEEVGAAPPGNPPAE